MSKQNFFFELDKREQVRGSFVLSGKGNFGASKTVYEHPSEQGKGIGLYHPKEREKFEQKVRTMIKVKYNRPNPHRFDFAWPENIIVDSDGTFSGFRMPFYGDGWVDLDSIMQAHEAEAKYSIGDRHRLLIAANVSLAVQKLHELGVHCVDLKPQNIRVNISNAAIGILDCDGMSIVDISKPNSKRFRADKSTPDFWAPENFGIDPSKFSDEEEVEHDNFALAVIIFMLLNRGIHPYMGELLYKLSGADDAPGKIKNDLYPYTTGKGKIAPHEDSLYMFWPERLQRLFDRAFSTPRNRPSAKVWFDYFEQLKTLAVPCEKNPLYHVKIPSVGCPVCNRDLRNPKKSVVYSGIAPSAPGITKAAFVARQIQPSQNTPVQATSASTQYPKQNIQIASSTRGSGIGRIALVALSVLGLLAFLSSIMSSINSPTSSPNTPTQRQVSPCFQQDRFDAAWRAGADGLKQFVRECRSVGGPHLQRAESSLNGLLYNQAYACMGRSCDLRACLSIYTEYFPSGGNLDHLQRTAQHEASNRCNRTFQRHPSPSGTIWCPNPGASFGWRCPVGSRCSPGGGCTR